MSAAEAQERDRVFTQAALAEASQCIACVDTAGRVLWVNNGFAVLSGLPVEAHGGRLLLEVLPAAWATVDRQVREVLQRGAPLVDVVLNSSADAAARSYTGTIRPVHAADGQLLGACLVCTDVTEIKALADQFLQSQKMEAVGLLSNVIAHDFNNLLTVIQGYSELLLRNSADEAKRTKRLTEIHAAAEAAGHLSRQLLTLSRRNVGAVGPVDVNLLVRAISRMLDRVLPANVAQEVVLAEDLGLTFADPGQVEQVLMNLLTNAIDAMPAGGLLTIETTTTTAGDGDRSPRGAYVTIAVTDTGEGMDAATQARLFEPGFTTKTAGRGTGLGLAAVRTTVVQLHGDVSFVSAPGKGSTFTVRLPRVPEPVVADELAPVVPSGTRVPTVLVVEDHAGVRATLVNMLEDAGYQVIAVPAGGDAINAADEHQGPIDLLIADFELPDAVGPTLAEQLRTSRPHMHVLVSSGFGEQALSADAARRQGYEIISKPFTMRDLLRTIELILHSAPPATPVAS